MGGRLRVLLTIIILLGVVSWVILSYLPDTVVALPQFQYSSIGPVQVFPALAVVSFLVFIGLQLWVVQSTASSIRRRQGGAQGEQTDRFALSVGKEAALTALPIAFTVLLAAASYGWWQRLLTAF